MYGGPKRERALASSYMEVTLNVARVVTNLHPLVTMACEFCGDAAAAGEGHFICRQPVCEVSIGSWGGVIKQVMFL